MNILLTGAHIENKGDELMLLAVRERLRSRPVAHRMVRHRMAGSYEDRAQHGFYQLLWPRKLWSLSGSLGHFIMSRYGGPFGIIPEEQIDAVLDFSGFSFTDEWGPENAEKTADTFGRWQKSGKRIAMLPQSFGPFHNARTIAAVRRLVGHCRLVFARDTESLAMLKGAVGDTGNVECAPDFTNLIAGAVPGDFDVSNPYVCIVPNHWLVKKASAADAAQYVGSLTALVKDLLQRDIRPVLVLHAPFQDRELADAIQAGVGRPVEVAPYTHPVLLKGVLGRATAVVSSRFHALVGSLSQAVPSVGIGWTHKFGRLFAEYDVPDLSIEWSAPAERLVDVVRGLVDGPQRAGTVNTLQHASARHEQLSLAMWERVQRELGI